MSENSESDSYECRVPVCPECGEIAKGTLEEVQGVALVHADPGDEHPAYSGETEIDWNSQKTVSRGKYPVWVCGCGHVTAT